MMILLKDIKINMTMKTKKKLFAVMKKMKLIKKV